MTDEPVSTLRRIVTLTAAGLFLLTVVPGVSLAPDVPEVAPAAAGQNIIIDPQGELKDCLQNGVESCSGVSPPSTDPCDHLPDCDPDPGAACRAVYKLLGDLGIYVTSDAGDCIPNPSTDPCDYLGQATTCPPSTNPCSYVNCNPSVPCKDEVCPQVCIPRSLEHEWCSPKTVCGYVAYLESYSGRDLIDCIQQICDAEMIVGTGLAYTGDTDNDGIEDCHDPDVDGDGLSNLLESEIGYNEASSDGDDDQLSDAVDLISGDDRNVKVWVQLKEFEQVDWSDLRTWPDPYLKPHAGLSVGDADPDTGNRFAFEDLQEGSHVHDPGMDSNGGYTFDTTGGRNSEVVANLPQRWSDMTYPSIGTDGVIELRWEMPLWDHDHDYSEDNLEGDEQYGSLSEAEMFFLLMEIAQSGSHPASIEGSTETPSASAENDEFQTKDITLDFGDDADLRVEIGANVPMCAMHLAREASSLGDVSDPDYGNQYIGLGIGDDPLNGGELTTQQRNDCQIDTDRERYLGISVPEFTG